MSQALEIRAASDSEETGNFTFLSGNFDCESNGTKQPDDEPLFGRLWMNFLDDFIV
jgi:hypothetical protein